MVIETKRLILRPFLEGDAADVYEYLKAPAVNCFVSMKLHSLDEARKEMKKRLGETEYYFAITLRDGGKVIGTRTFRAKGMPSRQPMRSLTTFSPKKAQGVFMPIPRTITFPVSTYAKSWECAAREHSWSLSPSFQIPMAHPSMKTPCSMPSSKKNGSYSAPIRPYTCHASLPSLSRLLKQSTALASPLLGGIYSIHRRQKHFPGTDYTP